MWGEELHHALRSIRAGKYRTFVESKEIADRLSQEPVWLAYRSLWRSMAEKHISDQLSGRETACPTCLGQGCVECGYQGGLEICVRVHCSSCRGSGGWRNAVLGANHKLERGVGEWHSCTACGGAGYTEEHQTPYVRGKLAKAKEQLRAAERQLFCDIEQFLDSPREVRRMRRTLRKRQAQQRCETAKRQASTTRAGSTEKGPGKTRATERRSSRGSGKAKPKENVTPVRSEDPEEERAFRILMDLENDDPD